MQSTWPRAEQERVASDGDARRRVLAEETPPSSATPRCSRSPSSASRSTTRATPRNPTARPDCLAVPRDRLPVEGAGRFAGSR
jgi:hypothetical protein